MLECYRSEVDESIGTRGQYLIAVMGKCASVVLLLALCWVVAPADPPGEMDMDTDVCAMTEVLVAMKKLLMLLSTEIRDLREQVKNSCQSSGTTSAKATTSPSTVVEPLGTQGAFRHTLLLSSKTYSFQ